jgi:hypothetical protein
MTRLRAHGAYVGGLRATAGPVRSPRIVMLDRVVKSLLRRQAFVKVGHYGDVAGALASSASRIRNHRE